MSSTLILVAIALIALGAGFTGGLMMGLRKRSNRDAIMELEARLEQAMESRADYEADVSEHFARTSQLLDKLTDDYRAIHSHLASGAAKLCDGDVTIPTPSLESVDDDAEIPANMIDVMQPLDYAPRNDPDAQGQLSESFGLEKSRFEESAIHDRKAD